MLPNGIQSARRCELSACAVLRARCCEYGTTARLHIGTLKAPMHARSYTCCAVPSTGIWTLRLAAAHPALAHGQTCTRHRCLLSFTAPLRRPHVLQRGPGLAFAMPAGGGRCGLGTVGATGGLRCGRGLITPRTASEREAAWCWVNWRFDHCDGCGSTVPRRKWRTGACRAHSWPDVC